MLGAIIGDIVGSRFEFHNHRSTDFDLFSPQCDFTDDSICTVAVADALVRGLDFGEALHQWCRRYPDPMGSYGGRFARWVASDDPQPYGSLGNGSAMRVSPCGWLPLLEEALATSEGSALPTHDHPEGIKGAQLVAHAIWLLRHGASKADILELAEQHYGYRVSGLSVEQLRRTNVFDEICPGTIPPALCCFIESKGFEDALRQTVSIGGDTDTLCAIVGGLAEACYGIPEQLQQQALAYLPSEMIAVIDQFQALYQTY